MAELTGVQDAIIQHLKEYPGSTQRFIKIPFAASTVKKEITNLCRMGLVRKDNHKPRHYWAKLEKSP